MRRKTLAVEDCVGTVLAHDLIRVVPGQVKENRRSQRSNHPGLKPQESAGHGTAPSVCLDLGPDEMPENDAAAQLSWLCGGPRGEHQHAGPRQGQSHRPIPGSAQDFSRGWPPSTPSII